MRLVHVTLESFHVNLLARVLTVFAKIMTFDKKHDERIKFFVAVNYTDQLARVSLSKYLLQVSGTGK